MSRLKAGRFIDNDDYDQKLEDLIRYHIYNVKTAQPAYVYDFKPDLCAVDIRLGVQVDLRGTNQDVSIITNVPICYPSSSKFSMTFPLERGDTGLAIFCESSIDRWLNVEEGENEIVNPRDTRMHDYTDAIFIPGIKQYTRVDEPINDEDVCIQYGEVKIKLQEKGRFCIETPEGEFLDELTQALAALNTALGGVATPQITKLLEMICKDSIL